MVREWKPMRTSNSMRVLLSVTNRIFLHKYSLKLQMISKQIVSSYHVNRLTCLMSISIHRSRFPKLGGGRGGRTRIGSRTRQRRTRISVASAVNAVTINLHASSMKFGLIGMTPMTWYSEISSHMLSNGTGTVLTRLTNFCEFTSKTSSNPG